MANKKGFVTLVNEDLKKDFFKKEKFKEVLHYIISECGNRPNVGITVLYKLLFYSDFNYYEICEEKMTGESYFKLPKGPAPVHFSSMANELETEGKINQYQGSYMGYPQKKYKSLQSPKLTLLNKGEVEIIDKVIEECGYMNATEISDYSHGDISWKATEDNEEIDYELVFYRDSKCSARAQYGYIQCHD
ncbi:SocA family protein [Methanobacterium sp. YSL]|nr:SocA family protein [Methanobacterium sp. YSL]